MALMGNQMDIPQSKLRAPAPNLIKVLGASLGA
jgi:hypothetical protein